MDFCFGLIAIFLILDVISVQSTAPANDFTSSAPPKIDPPISNLSPLKAPIKINPVRTISELKCKEYMEIAGTILATSNLSLSKRWIQPSVIGGINAERNESPHMVALGKFVKGNFNFSLMCGGTLISDTWVLSAAHCTHGPNGGPSVAKLGILKLSDQNGVTIAIKNTITHPDYKPPAMYADIALIELDNSVTFSISIRPACLYQQNNTMPNQALITGWGLTEIDGEVSDQLQKADLYPIDNLTCTTWYNNSKEIPYGIAPSMICAGEGNKDTCLGDSGGPLQIVHPENSKFFQVIGITSFGLSCGILPSIYTRVSYYLPWIEEKVWPQEQQ